MEAGSAVLRRVVGSAPQMGGREPRILGALALASVIVLALRSRLASGEDQLSGDAARSRKRKAKAKRNKQEKTSDLDAAPQLERKTQTDYYELRKGASTMGPEAVAWFHRNMDALLSPPGGCSVSGSGSEKEGDDTAGTDTEGTPEATSNNVDPVSKPSADAITVLSIGCGDGTIDLEVIKTIARSDNVTKVNYVGIEPCSETAAAFRDRIAKAREEKDIGSDVITLVLETELDDRPLRVTASSGSSAPARGFHSKHQFDLVLMVHVLHCFKNPYGAIQRAMLQTKPGGRIVAIQPNANGITQITSELTRDTQGSDSTLFNADELKRLLLQHRLQPTVDVYETRLDVTPCLNRTAAGVKIMSACMQRDLRKLKEAKVMRVLKSFWRLAVINDDGSAHIKEPTSAFVVEKPMNKK